MNAPTHDSDLAAAAALGDRDAFEELYRRHSRRVYTYLAYTTRTRDDAEELTQEVFVLAWRKLAQFRGESAFSTWLMSIAVSACRMWHRSRRARGRAVRVDLELIESADDGRLSLAATGALRPASAGSREDISAEERMDLRVAVATLPPRARSVLVLHDLSGYRHEEIARLMGITAGTSKAQLHRAKRLLREALGYE